MSDRMDKRGINDKESLIEKGKKIQENQQFDRPSMAFGHGVPTIPEQDPFDMAWLFLRNIEYAAKKGELSREQQNKFIKAARLVADKEMQLGWGDQQSVYNSVGASILNIQKQHKLDLQYNPERITKSVIVQGPSGAYQKSYTAVCNHDASVMEAVNKLEQHIREQEKHKSQEQSI